MPALNGRRVSAQEGHNDDYSVFDNYLVKVKIYMKNHNRSNLKKKKIKKSKILTIQKFQNLCKSRGLKHNSARSEFQSLKKT